MMKPRPRRVGLGMKPREVSAVAGQQEESIESAVADLSTGEGQEEVAEEAVSEAVVGEPEGDPLGFEGLQNLESGEAPDAAEVENEPIVAPLSNFGPVPAVPQEAFDTLADLMKQSKALTGAAPYIPPPEDERGTVITFTEAAKMGLPPVEGADGYTIFNGKPYMVGIDEGVERVPAVDKTSVQLTTDGAIKLGELPNGEYRATVRVPEGYWEGVKSAAEADHVSVEDWLTNELAQRLEDTFFGRR